MFDVIILAAGQGSRAKLGYNKVLFMVDSETIIEKSIKAFLNIDKIKNIFVVVNPDEKTKMATLLKNYPITLVTGSTQRYLSVKCGLDKIVSDYVLIHDGARCNVDQASIIKLMDTVLVKDAAFLGVKSKDTIHIIEDHNIITPNREHTFIAQTPQGFKSSIIKQAYQLLLESDHNYVTDDVMIVKKYLNINSEVVLANYNNFKYTTPEDFQ